jgi:CubicO group peptidase (beta-lactamase class C family)
LLSLMAVQSTAYALADKAVEIDSLLTRSQRYDLFNGAALVAEGGEVILQKGYGWANMEWEIPNTPDTKFRLGSVTKQFTAMLVMQLVEAGLIDLDGTISDYLPYYREDTGQRITIHYLLSHQTGIPNLTEDPDYAEFSKLPSSVEALVRERCSGDLLFEPGEQYRYSNSNYVILGAIIEAVTGEPYAAVLKEQILDPLEMQDSGCDRNTPIFPNRAAGYGPTIEGYANARYIDMGLPHAAGGMYATVEDLYRWDQALYTDQLLTDEHRERLFTPNRNGYAYGWIVRPRPIADTGDSVLSVSHGGGINGFVSVIVRIPGDKHLVVLLSNTEDASLSDITRAIVNIL